MIFCVIHAQLLMCIVCATNLGGAQISLSTVKSTSEHENASLLNALLRCQQNNLCWTYSHHCQIADKNPSKDGTEIWGVSYMCWMDFHDGILCCGFLCARLISVCLFRLPRRGLPRPTRLSFPATTPHRYLTATTSRATTPVQIHSS